MVSALFAHGKLQKKRHKHKENENKHIFLPTKGKHKQQKLFANTTTVTKLTTNRRLDHNEYAYTYHNQRGCVLHGLWIRCTVIHDTKNMLLSDSVHLGEKQLVYISKTHVKRRISYQKYFEMQL